MFFFDISLQSGKSHGFNFDASLFLKTGWMARKPKMWRKPSSRDSRMFRWFWDTLGFEKKTHTHILGLTKEPHKKSPKSKTPHSSFCPFFPSCLTKNKRRILLYIVWSNYSDLTRPHPKWWFSKGNPLISGKSGLVKYYILTRYSRVCKKPISKLVLLGCCRHQQRRLSGGHGAVGCK